MITTLFLLRSAPRWMSPHPETCFLSRNPVCLSERCQAMLRAIKAELPSHEEARGHGMLINELCAGRIVWNKVRMIKLPLNLIQQLQDLGFRQASEGICGRDRLLTARAVKLELDQRHQLVERLPPRRLAIEAAGHIISDCRDLRDR